MSSSVKLYADRRERELNLKERKEQDRVKVSYNFRWLQPKNCVFVTSRVFWIQSDWKSFVALFHVAFLKQHFPHERFWTNIAFHSIERMLFPGNLRSNDSLEDTLRPRSPWFEVVQSPWLQMNRSTRSTGVKICENIRTLYFCNTRDIGVRIFIKGSRLSLGGVTNYWCPFASVKAKFCNFMCPRGS